MALYFGAARVDEVPAADVSYLDAQLLDENGRVKLLPSAFYRQLPHDHIRIWCVQRARYTLPTLELVEWLRDRIGERNAIEVGAGMGDLGYHIPLIMTDSGIQRDPKVRAHYLTMQQAPTSPPPDVYEADAKRAIRKFRPEVVVAAWLTRKFILGRDMPGRAQAFQYGAREEEIVAAATYIHIGNLEQHDEKSILALPHEEVFAPWLVSRAKDQSRNVIWVWEKGSTSTSPA